MGRRRKHHRQGRQPPQKMLDMGRRGKFKYHVKRALRSAEIDDDYVNSFYTTLFSKSSRQSIGDAKDYVDEKFEEELIEEDVRDELHRILEHYATMR